MKAPIFIILSVGLCFFLCSFSGNQAEICTLTANAGQIDHRWPV